MKNIFLLSIILASSLNAFSKSGFLCEYVNDSDHKGLPLVIRASSEDTYDVYQTNEYPTDKSIELTINNTTKHAVQVFSLAKRVDNSNQILELHQKFGGRFSEKSGERILTVDLTTGEGQFLIRSETSSVFSLFSTTGSSKSNTRYELICTIL